MLLFFGPIAIDFIRLHDHYDDVDCLEPRKMDHSADVRLTSTIYDAISAYSLTRVATQSIAFDTNMRERVRIRESEQFCFSSSLTNFHCSTCKGARTKCAWLVKSTRAQIQ